MTKKIPTRLFGTFATVLCVVVSAAQAQQTTSPIPPSPAAPAAAASAGGGTLEHITVTGYIIPRVGEGPQPVVTYDQDFISKQAVQNVNDDSFCRAAGPSPGETRQRHPRGRLATSSLAGG